MSNKNSQREAIEIETLATITGGLFGSAQRRTDAWNQAYRSGKLSGPGSTLDFIQKDATRPRWAW